MVSFTSDACMWSSAKHRYWCLLQRQLAPLVQGRAPWYAHSTATVYTRSALKRIFTDIIVSVKGAHNCVLHLLLCSVLGFPAACQAMPLLLTASVQILWLLLQSGTGPWTLPTL